MLVFQKQIYSFLIISFSIGCNPTKTTITKSQEKYPSGTIKWYKEIKTIQNKHIKRDAGFVRIITTYQHYYENGKIYLISRAVKDAGVDVSCRETKYSVIQYYSNGNKMFDYKMECDCHKEITKNYNEDGKLLNTTKNKIKRLY